MSFILIYIKIKTRNRGKLKLKSKNSSEFIKSLYLTNINFFYQSQFEVPEIVLEESVHGNENQNLDSKTGRSLRSRKNIDYSE